MIPHKSKRGTEAMNRLKVFDGIPYPHDKVGSLTFSPVYLWKVSNLEKYNMELASLYLKIQNDEAFQNKRNIVWKLLIFLCITNFIIMRTAACRVKNIVFEKRYLRGGGGGGACFTCREKFRFAHVLSWQVKRYISGIERQTEQSSVCFGSVCCNKLPYINVVVFYFCRKREWLYHQPCELFV